MYKRLLLILIVLFLNACSQQTRGITPPTYTKSHMHPYSLEALDAQYHQGQ